MLAVFIGAEVEMKHDDWPSFCEKLLSMLEALGEDTIRLRAEFGVLMVDYYMKETTRDGHCNL